MNIATTVEDMKPQPSIFACRGLPILAELSEADLDCVSGFFTVADLAQGETLYSEGEAATSACILLSGVLDAFASLPGGGETKVGTIRSGAVLGEMALLNGGERTATVRAREPARVLEVSSMFFMASLGRMDLPTHKLLRGVISVIAMRLNQVWARCLKEMVDVHLQQIAAADPTSGATGTAMPKQKAMDIFRFVPFLPGLKILQPAEITAIISLGNLIQSPAASFLYQRGTQARAAYLVLRGSAVYSAPDFPSIPMEVMGPGRLCGINELITGETRQFDAVARSDALLLELPGDVFMGLFRGESEQSLKFQQIIGRNQLKDLKTANNRLALIVNQKQIRTGVQRRP